MIDVKSRKNNDCQILCKGLNVFLPVFMHFGPILIKVQCRETSRCLSYTLLRDAE